MVKQEDFLAERNAGDESRCLVVSSETQRELDILQWKRVKEPRGKM